MSQLGALLKMKILAQEVWSETQEPALLINSQIKLLGSPDTSGL